MQGAGKADFVFEFELTKTKIAVLLGLLFVCVLPFGLGSENIVLGSAYPVPYGAYSKLKVTNALSVSSVTVDYTNTITGASGIVSIPTAAVVKSNKGALLISAAGQIAFTGTSGGVELSTIPVTPPSGTTAVYPYLTTDSGDFCKWSALNTACAAGYTALGRSTSPTTGGIDYNLPAAAYTSNYYLCCRL